MSPLKAGAAAFLALATGPFGGIGPSAGDVPPGIPAGSGWERITGDVEFESPRLSVRYEFWVNPERPAIYEVVRYRVVELERLPSGRGHAVSEKLQWDKDGRDLRRFECVTDADGGCAWREMEKGGADYLREVPVLMWIYGVHREANRVREAAGNSTHLASPRRVILAAPSGG